jgi:hypothetical protein
MRLRDKVDAGWSSPVARQAHNLKVTGSNPVPATRYEKSPARPGFFLFGGQGRPRLGGHFRSGA